MKSLRGKRALITGAASGIGRAIALAFAREGIHLFLVDIDEAGLAQVVAEAESAGVETVGKSCDLASADEITGCLQGLLSEWGTLDIVVNNAGITFYGPTHEMTEQQWNRLLGINLSAPIQITRELLPTLLGRKEAHIVNIGSLAGLVAGPKLAAYNVSKFGLQGFSESLIAEYGRSGLGVTSVCPGFIKTSIFRTAFANGPSKRDRTPPNWMMASPESVAAKVVRAIRKKQPLVVVTLIAKVLWILKRISPPLFLNIFRSRWKHRRPKTPHVPTQALPQQQCRTV